MTRRRVEAVVARRWSRPAFALLVLAAFAMHAAHGAPTAAPEPAASSAASSAPWVPAYAAFGAPKYGPGFKHFDY
ncbi:MAG TPA: hypothetical protein PLV92_20930, partial [Pirellulaceae bacterium]|nr:hypothetical protein [Pirellulaceae bacterium]